MVNSSLNIAQEDSLKKVKTAFCKQRIARVDADVAEREFEFAVKLATTLDRLTIEQVAEEVGLDIAVVEDARVRAAERSVNGDEDFRERFAEVYPEKVAETERTNAIRAARKSLFFESIGMGDRNPPANE